MIIPKHQVIQESNSRMEVGGHLETQLLLGVSDPSRWSSPNTKLFKNPTPGWRMGVILMRFLMTYLDEIGNTASPGGFWVIKMTISNQPVHKGTNSRMEDGGHLDEIPDDLSRRNFKHSFSMTFLTHQDDQLLPAHLSRIQLQDRGWGSS